MIGGAGSLLDQDEELQHLRLMKQAAHNQIPIMGDGVDLEHVLGQIEASYSDFSGHGRPLSSKRGFR
jgi:hypothetical protein